MQPKSENFNFLIHFYHHSLISGRQCTERKVNARILTLIACCMNNMEMRSPNNSPATLVNLLIMEHAPKMESKTNRKEVHTHTLYIKEQSACKFLT
jgi:hypothetical protein